MLTIVYKDYCDGHTSFYTQYEGTNWFGLFSIHSNLLEFNVLCQIHQAPSSLSILRKLISVLSTKIGFYALEMSKSVNSFGNNICLLVHINTHLENNFYL